MLTVFASGGRIFCYLFTFFYILVFWDKRLLLLYNQGEIMFKSIHLKIDSKYNWRYVILLKKIPFKFQGFGIRYRRIDQKSSCPLWGCWFQTKLWLGFSSRPHSPGELNGCARNLNQMCGWCRTCVGYLYDAVVSEHYKFHCKTICLSFLSIFPYRCAGWPWPQRFYHSTRSC